MTAKIKLIFNDQHGVPVIYFGNHLLFSSLLSKSARDLLDVLTIHMGEEDNVFHSSSASLNVYLKYCKDELKINYTKKTVRESIAELEQLGLIAKLRVNSYQVNRDLFMRLSSFVNLLLNYDDVMAYKERKMAHIDKLSNEKLESLLSSVRAEINRCHALYREV